MKIKKIPILLTICLSLISCSNDENTFSVYVFQRTSECSVCSKAEGYSAVGQEYKITKTTGDFGIYNYKFTKNEDPRNFGISYILPNDLLTYTYTKRQEKNGSVTTVSVDKCEYTNFTSRDNRFHECSRFKMTWHSTGDGFYDYTYQIINLFDDGYEGENKPSILFFVNKGDYIVKHIRELPEEFEFYARYSLDIDYSTGEHYRSLLTPFLFNPIEQFDWNMVDFE